MSAPNVLVAHESEPIRVVIETLLRAAGFAVTPVATGSGCRRALESRPAGLVIDVALTDVHAFQLIEEARRASPGVFIVLVASVYNRTSYKRRPTSLYGADDYVEQHHIADSLVPKLQPLLARAAAAPSPESRPSASFDSQEAETVRLAGQARFDAPIPAEVTPEAITRAERLARLIVADIALYNGDALEAARRANGVESMEARLRADLEEGRLLFDLRVPAAVRKGRDFIGEALGELLRGSDPRKGAGW